MSQHETSKVALVMATAAFLLSWQSPNWCDRVIRFSWMTMCLGVIPLALAAYRLNFQNVRWFQASAQQRFVIWNYTAEQALKLPVLGIGAGNMYFRAASNPNDEGRHFSAIAPHAHNVYLQTWFELGAVGAALLTLVGLAVLERIGRLSERFIPYAHATFASAASVAASSYGMWQIWFVTMYALIALVFAIGMRVNIQGDTIPEGDGPDY